MLYDIYYIVKPGALQQPVKVGAYAVIALEIEITDTENNTFHFQLVEDYLPGTPFCLLLHLHKTLTPNQATDLLAFLFFSNYNKPGGTPQIIVGGENIALIQSGIEQLQHVAMAQGFANIHITLAADLPVHSSTDKSAIKEIYRSWLQASTITKDILYIQVEQLADLQATREILEAEEALYSAQNPGHYRLKLQNRDLSKQVQQLEQFFEAAQQEISNQVSHNQILRSSSQATALQNYYNNEYEVLPLWFKRLGHVVKALTGKRSFSSLFSDKVKKYRD